MMFSKKGVIIENVLFIVLNLVFFVVMMVFIVSSMNSRPVLEQAYAKQVALLIDQAKPNMLITVDINDAKKLVGEFNNNIRLDKINKKVIVSFGSGGKSYQYFSNNDISLEIKLDHLLIRVK